MAISIIDHSAKIVSKIVGRFEEMIPVRSGFSGWFQEETTPTLEVDVEVQRDSDLIAVDVVRFTEGNKNKYTKASEHKYIPPFFKEDYDFQRDAIYMNTVAMGVTGNPNINRVIAQNALKAVNKNRDKIKRAISKQQADVLQTGIVSLVNGDNIDFRRKAESLKNVSDGPGEYWSNASGCKPIDDLAAGMRFLRDVGNSSGGTVNVVMRTAALNAFLNSTQVKESADIRRIDRVNIAMPQFSEASGFALQGQIAAGDFVVNLWTYNEKYTNSSNQTVYYLDENKVIMLPDDFMGKTVFGGLPVLNETTVGGTTVKVPGVVEANYLIRAYSDEKTISSTIELTSAPLVIPFTIDKIYTMQVFA